MKEMRHIYIPVLIFVGIILIAVAISHGDPKSRHSLGYVSHNANNDGIILNSSTFTKILDINLDRSSVTFCSKSKQSENKVIFINYAPVAESVNNTGIILFGEDCYTMLPRATYTGEISAISTSGSPLLTYIEY